MSAAMKFEIHINHLLENLILYQLAVSEFSLSQLLIELLVFVHAGGRAFSML